MRCTMGTCYPLRQGLVVQDASDMVRARGASASASRGLPCCGTALKTVTRGAIHA